MARRDSYRPVTWSCWKTSHLAEDTLLSWAINPDFYYSLADYAQPCRMVSISWHDYYICCGADRSWHIASIARRFDLRPLLNIRDRAAQRRGRARARGSNLGSTH